MMAHRLVERRNMRLNRLWAALVALAAALSLGGCVSSHTTYAVARDGSGTYDCQVTVAPAAVAYSRAKNLADDPDTPFATVRTAVLDALRRQGFSAARLDAASDSSGLQLRLRVSVRDVRHFALVDAILAKEFGPLAPRQEFALRRLPDGWQASCRFSQPVSGGEGAIGILMTLDAIARADGFSHPETDSYGLAMLDYVCAGNACAVDLKVPAAGGDTIVHWQLPVRALLLADTDLLHTLEAPPVRLDLPDAVPELPPAIAAAPADSNAAAAGQSLRRDRYDEAVAAALLVRSSDRRDALLENIAGRILGVRRRDYALVERIEGLLRSPGRRARLGAAFARRRALDADMDARDAAMRQAHDALLPSDTQNVANAVACLDSGWLSDAAGIAGRIRDTSTREALLLRVVEKLASAGEFAEAERLTARLGAATRATAAGLLNRARAAAAAREAMQRQVYALDQRIARAEATEFKTLWQEAEAVPDAERRAYLQATIACRTAEGNPAQGLALARSIADTASMHRANSIAAVATMYLDAQRDTEGREALDEAAAAAAYIGNALERCGVLGYIAQEYARTGQDAKARDIIRQVQPQLAGHAATRDHGGMDQLRTAAEWLAMAGAWLHDSAVVESAISLVNDAAWRSVLRRHLTRIAEMR